MWDVRSNLMYSLTHQRAYNECICWLNMSRQESNYETPMHASEYPAKHIDYIYGCNFGYILGAFWIRLAQLSLETHIPHPCCKWSSIEVCFFFLEKAGAVRIICFTKRKFNTLEHYMNTFTPWIA